MKYCFALFFCILSFFGVSQSETKSISPIKKLNLSEASLLSDLLPDLTKKYNSIIVEIGGINSGKHNSVVFYKNELPDGAKKILLNADVDSKLFISVENKDEGKTTKKTYLFKVVE
jgi:hypothetical protein